MATTTPLQRDDAVADPRVQWRPDARGTVARLVVFGALMLAAVAAPVIVPSTDVNLVTNAFVFGIIALSMNCLLYTSPSPRD